MLGSDLISKISLRKPPTDAISKNILTLPKSCELAEKVWNSLYLGYCYDKDQCCQICIQVNLSPTIRIEQESSSIIVYRMN